MRELLRTNDVVLISYAEALLAGHQIHTFVLDSYTSVLEGSLNILPRRLMVIDEQEQRARDILQEADIEVSRYE